MKIFGCMFVSVCLLARRTAAHHIIISARSLVVGLIIVGHHLLQPYPNLERVVALQRVARKVALDAQLHLRAKAERDQRKSDRAKE
jgi:hypothetical protein